MTDAGSPATATPRRVLFVTGRLAEPALRRVLASTTLPFAHDVAVLRITVAALMTTREQTRNMPSRCPSLPAWSDRIEELQHAVARLDA